MSARQRFFDTATIACFLAALLGPALDQCLRPDEVRDSSIAEQRKPEPRPATPATVAEVTSFPHRYEEHYNDTFGLRDVLLRWNSIERALDLGVSPARTVALADDGWCFYLGERAREAQRGTIPFTESELDAWMKRLRERRDFLAQRGVKYLYVPCPSKNVIYPERAGPSWAPIGPSRLEQLLARLERDGDVPFLDLRPALVAAKAGDKFEDWIYTRCGTHWNARGMYAAYQAIVARLAVDFPSLACLPFSSFDEIEKKDSTDSMARLLYVSDLLPQRHCGLQSKKRGYDVLLETPPRTGARVITRKAIDAPRLLWLHDSFGPFTPMFESFSYVQSHRVFEFSMDEVREARPDVVLETYVDRVLNYQRPEQPMTGNATPPEEQFERLKDVAWRDEFGDRFAPAQAIERAAVERGDEGLLLRTRGPKGGLCLPSIELARGKFALLRLTAECDEPVDVDVFLRNAGEPMFPLQNHVALLLSPEAPTATVRLPNVGAHFETLVRPRSPAKELRIRALEVRRGPAGS